MEVKHYRGTTAGTAQVDQAAFGDKVRYRTLKDAVVMWQANQRLGTVNTRTRADVSGSNKKPYRQKKTGRARAGDRKSPIWRGGGIVFGPTPRDYSYHMPAKARRVALRSAILGKLQDGEWSLCDFAGFAEPAAKSARQVLAASGGQGRALIVLAAPNENVWKSFRNFPGVKVRTAAELCAFDVVAGGIVLAEPQAMELLSQRVGIKADGGAA